MAESVLLQTCFHLLPSKKLFEVRLTRKKLFYQQTSIDSCWRTSNSPLFSVNLEDVYGGKVFRSRSRNNINSYLHIFTCPVEGKRRVRGRIRFKVSGWEDADSNVRCAERWLKMILWLVKHPGIDVDTIKDRKLPSQRKLLVFVNPCSGSGKSLAIFKKNVVPMFTEASIDYTLRVTEYAGHAEKIALELNIEEWDGLVICSGDGLVHELVNGLMKRPDWKRAMTLPMGVIPTGSGNALCYSALYASGEPFDLTAAVFAVIRGQTLDLDLCAIETPSQKLFSFLSLSWGMISDVDMESEKYRRLGNARFTLGAIIRILNLRTYRGKLSYLPPDEAEHPTTSLDLPKEETKNEDDDLANFYSLPGSPSGSFYNTKSAPEEKPPKINSSHENIGMLDSAHPSINDISQTVSEHRGTLSMPSIAKRLPSNWKTIEGEFILSSCVLISHLDGNCNFAPEAKFGDGFLYMAYIKSGVSKLRLLATLKEMETGIQVNSDDFFILKACAFRLEPDLSQQGTMAVDGERLPYSEVQGEVYKGVGRVMCGRPYSF
uniref:Sphingosine kinase 1 n=1 Tax=Exaiptasia diaphana TaxID=2652724 RepID=A0A1S7DKT5_EXADI|nr:sphingosine kinase 1 [Exaiptasia diaphana]